jgi:hypothetical protein
MTRLNIPSTRKTGRKIETWTFQGQDDTIKIDVYLHSDRSTGPKFTAISAHKTLAKTTWTDTDISRLAKTVETEIDTLISELSENFWRPCIILEVQPDHSISEDQNMVSIAMKMSEAQLDIRAPSGNDGRRRIEQKGRITSVQERSFSDDSFFDGPAGRIKLDTSISRVIIQDTHEARQSMQALQSTLERFGRLLAHRFSPDRADPDNIPEPQDLVEMMSKAVNTTS